jgi:hypothetical protein
MSSVNLTWAQDPGGITELLSGKFYEPLGRSSSRQMWSSAMVISVALRGMLGIEADALHHNLRVAPALPASWDQVDVRHLPFGNGRIDLSMRRDRGKLLVETVSARSQVLCLSTAGLAGGECSQAEASRHSTTIRLEPIEIGLEVKAPIAGSQTQQMKVLEERYSQNKLMLDLEAPGGSVQTAFLRVNRAKTPHLQVTGANIQGNSLRITFPPGGGYQKQRVLIQW